jgi:hypothetical protein
MTNTDNGAFGGLDNAGGTSKEETIVGLTEQILPQILILIWLVVTMIVARPILPQKKA